MTPAVGRVSFLPVTHNGYSYTHGTGTLWKDGAEHRRSSGPDKGVEIRSPVSRDLLTLTTTRLLPSLFPAWRESFPQVPPTPFYYSASFRDIRERRVSHPGRGHREVTEWTLEIFPGDPGGVSTTHSDVRSRRGGPVLTSPHTP